MATPVILLQQGLIEAPVLDALHAFKRRPREADVLVALKDERVLNASLCLAEKMRKLSQHEDERRKLDKKSPVNYRQFYVGSVGIGITLNGGGTYEWWAFAAANSKPAKKAPKFCAEMRIMRAARAVNCSCIGGFVVIGENQADDRSNVLRKTLDPCGECRDCMRHPDNRPRLRSNTMIVTQKPHSQVAYPQTLVQMMRVHKETWP